MILGVVCGMTVMWLGGTGGVIKDYVRPFGDIFMRLLKLIAVPLVILSLIKGVGNLGDIGSLSKIGAKTIGIYICTTIIAITLGLILVNIIGPGKVVSAEASAQMQQAYQSTITASSEQAEHIKEGSPLQFLVDMVPENIFRSMGDNSSMLQIIFFAILVGVAVLMVGRKESEPFMNFVDSLNSIVLKIIDIVMKFAPIGVFALMAGMVVDSAGNLSLMGALGIYVLTVIVGLALMVTVVYPLLMRSFTKITFGQFFRAMVPAQLLAFTTSSSAATLPVTMKQVTGPLGVSARTASFVLPVGVTINMDGTSLYQAVAAVFIAQVLGIDLTWLEMLTIVGTTTISSIGTPGIPGGSIVMSVMVLSSVGIPAEGLALILGLDRPLDMLRTVVNVTGDATVASIVDKEPSA